MVKKIPAISAKLVASGSVVCPDQESTCPDGTTCCVLASGKYGCCPMPNAVCCQDHLHCCPQGTTCNVPAQTCDAVASDVKAPITLLLQAAVKSSADVQVVKCPDGKSECPDGTTCCKLQTGQFGCCPMAKAVCCSDQIHCCPDGYQCKNGTCEKPTAPPGAIPWFSKFLANQIAHLDKAQAVICPDRQHECPDGTTCCRFKPQGWGCCPSPKAVCCADGLHCCPHGYKCDISRKSCTRVELEGRPGDVVSRLLLTRSIRNGN